MGISKVMACVATAFLAVSLCMKWSGYQLMSIPLLFCTSIACIISLASHPSIDFPLILGKNSGGRFPLWSKLAFGPYFVFLRLYVLFKKLKRKEPLYTEVLEGLYVGGWPSSVNQLPPGGPAVIDCTCELPRSSSIPKDAYLCIPLWDTRSPNPVQIEQAVRWACQKRDGKKPVYIHCGFGHGRSVCIMCALLVSLGLAENWKDAEKIVRARRPLIRMNHQHRENLEEWSKYRVLSKVG